MLLRMQTCAQRGRAISFSLSFLLVHPFLSRLSLCKVKYAGFAGMVQSSEPGPKYFRAVSRAQFNNQEARFHLLLDHQRLSDLSHTGASQILISFSTAAKVFCGEKAKKVERCCTHSTRSRPPAQIHCPVRRLVAHIPLCHTR